VNDISTIQASVFAAGCGAQLSVANLFRHSTGARIADGQALPRRRISLTWVLERAGWTYLLALAVKRTDTACGVPAVPAAGYSSAARLLRTHAGALPAFLPKDGARRLRG
jgi:hypothetical protein